MTAKISTKVKMCSAAISLKEIEEGKAFRAKNVDDLFKQCGIDVWDSLFFSATHYTFIKIKMSSIYTFIKIKMFYAYTFIKIKLFVPKFIRTFVGEINYHYSVCKRDCGLICDLA